MALSRRRWLSIAAGGFGMTRSPLSALLSAQAAASELPRRVSRTIREYEEQGFHRTATAVDEASADWLSAQVRLAGLTPTQEPFQISRVDPVAAVLIAGDHRLEGLPLFDGAFTDVGGVRGRLGPLASDAPIGIVEVAPAGPLAELSNARRANRHRAIICITKGDRQACAS